MNLRKATKYNEKNDNFIKPVFFDSNACFDVLISRKKNTLTRLTRKKLLYKVSENEKLLYDLVKLEYHKKATKPELAVFLEKIRYLKVDHSNIAIELKTNKSENNIQIIESLKMKEDIKEFYLNLTIGKELMLKLEESNNLNGDDRYDIQF